MIGELELGRSYHPILLSSYPPQSRAFRIWRLYMAGSAYGFSTGRLNVVQTLFGKPDATGNSELPLRRNDILI